MPEITASMLHVDNFLCFFSTRAGTKFLMYFMLLLNFNILVTCLSATMSDDMIFPVTVAGFTTIGIIISSICLLFFPEPYKRYDKNSKNILFLKFFSVYIGSFAIISLIIYTGAVFYDGGGTERNLLIFLGIPLATLCSGIFLHFMAVVYSFHRSILTIRNTGTELITY